MRYRFWIAMALAGTAIAVIGGSFTVQAIWAQPQATAATKSSAPLPDLYIADDKQDLGEVWETNDAILTVPISNRTDKPIEILDFESSCDCGEISPRRLTVPANGSANVTVKMDLTRRTIEQRNMVTRKLRFGLTPVLSTAIHVSTFYLTAIVKSAVTFSVQSVDFGEQMQSGSTKLFRLLTIFHHASIIFVRSDVSSAYLIEKVENADFATTLLKVTCVQDKPDRTVSELGIVIRANDLQFNYKLPITRGGIAN